MKEIELQIIYTSNSQRGMRRRAMWVNPDAVLYIVLGLVEAAPAVG